MFIQLSDVFTYEGKQMNAEAELEMTSFDNGAERFAITEKSPVSFTFTNLEKGKILVKGDMKLTLQAACDRCLTEVPVVLELHAERIVVSPETGTEDEEADDLSFMDGCQLNVETFVYNEIIGNWPAKILCKSGCKGICPVCGQNRNVRDCGCDSFVPDPRMAGIQDIFNGK